MTPNQKPISRNDLERSFQGVQSNLQGQVESRKTTIRTVLVAGGVVVLLVVFLFGRRSGKRKTTFVEVRRF